MDLVFFQPYSLPAIAFPSPFLRQVASGFASKRRSAVLSVKARHTLAVVIARLLLGANLSVMTPMDEEGDADINGASKRAAGSRKVKNTDCVSKNPKEVHSVRVLVPPAPNGAPIPHGPLVFVMIPTIVAVDVDTPGRSNPVKYLPSSSRLSAACASRKLKEALSAKVPVKAAADGVYRARITLIGRYLSAMTPITVVGDASISGFLIALPP